MYFKERYKDIIKTKAEVESKLNGECCFDNNVIHELRVVVTGHFGNCVSFDLLCDDYCPPAHYNNTKNIGFILACLIDLFEKSDDDSVDIKKAFSEIPVRLIFDGKESWGSKCVGVGHFMKDQFVFFDELCKLDK